MSQLLSALKTLRRTADADAVEVTQESSPTVEAIVARTGDATADDPMAESPEGPDIVWPADEPPAVPEFGEQSTVVYDDETLRLCDRILSQTPANQSTTIGLFRSSTTRTSRRVVGQLAAAVSMRTGQRVLVIDADWQTPDCSSAIAGDAPPGLGEVLLEEVKWAAAIVEVGQPPAKVSFLGPGRRIALPAAGSRFGLLIDEVRPHYRYVLIDGGLVAGSLATEVACCNQAYLVLGLDQTDRQQAVAAASALGVAGLDVAGCIVTYAA